jgi:hypothetical protein
MSSFMQAPSESRAAWPFYVLRAGNVDNPLWSDRPLRRVHGLEPDMRQRPSGRGPPH